MINLDQNSRSKAKLSLFVKKKVEFFYIFTFTLFVIFFCFISFYLQNYLALDLIVCYFNVIQRASAQSGRCLSSEFRIRKERRREDMTQEEKLKKDLEVIEKRTIIREMQDKLYRQI